ncbi:MAG: O-antigen ligase family protein [Gammaproteobacteria bacterium]|nr:O-antigen ligase family protein [Gammaproteobacteria bacterium]
MISLLVLLPLKGRHLGTDPVLGALGVLLAYIIFSAVYAYLQFGVPYTEQISKSYRGYIEMLTVAVALGWWLAARPNALFPVLVMAVSALLIRILIHIDWHDPLGYMATVRRPGFGMAVIHFALSAALSLVGLLVFSRRILGAGTSWTARFVVAVIFVFALGVVAYAFGLTLTRMAWLAFAVAVPWVMIYMVANRTQPFAGARARALLSIIMAISLVAVIWHQWDKIGPRVITEFDEFVAAAQLDGAHVGDGSIGLRYKALVWGRDRFEERPILGWGIGTFDPLKEKTDDVNLSLHHLHNLYMQVLVEMGLVGAALTALFLILLGQSVFRAYREGLFPSDVVVWLALSMLVAALWAMGNDKIWQAKVRNPFTFLFGVAMAIHFVRMEAHRLRRRRGSAAGSQDPAQGPGPGSDPGAAS